MNYSDLWFRGVYLAKEKKTVHDNGMRFASFTGWQILVSQGSKSSWEKHQIDVGLKKKIKLSKKDLEIEARIAMQNVKRLTEKATNGKSII
jgi:hypothetical protein